MKNKTKILSIIIVAVLVSSYLLVNFYKSRSTNEGLRREFAKYNKIPGEVIKVENNKVYFKTAILKSPPGQSPEQDHIIYEEKVAILNNETEIVRIKFGGREFEKIDLLDIKPSAKITIHYEGEENDGSLKARRVQLNQI